MWRKQTEPLFLGFERGGRRPSSPQTSPQHMHTTHQLRHDGQLLGLDGLGLAALAVARAHWPRAARRKREMGDGGMGGRRETRRRALQRGRHRRCRRLARGSCCCCCRTRRQPHQKAREKSKRAEMPIYSTHTRTHTRLLRVVLLCMRVGNAWLENNHTACMNVIAQCAPAAMLLTCCESAHCLHAPSPTPPKKTLPQNSPPPLLGTTLYSFAVL